MEHLKISTTLFMFLIWIFILSGHAKGNYIFLYVTNKCSFPIWPAIAPNAGNPVIANGGFFLPTGQTKRIQAPLDWSGRLWARTGCDFSGTSKPACETGDCGGLVACGGRIGLPPVTLFQVSFKRGKPSTYDVSLVDGYNLPISVSAHPSTANCFIGGCRKNPNSICPRELLVLNKKKEIVACKSACLAFDLDVFCCRNAYSCPERCKATPYSKLFKDACPFYVSYAFDTPSPAVTCTSNQYFLSFCPSNRVDHTLI